MERWNSRARHHKHPGQEVNHYEGNLSFANPLKNPFLRDRRLLLPIHPSFSLLRDYIFVLMILRSVLTSNLHHHWKSAQEADTSGPSLLSQLFYVSWSKHSVNLHHVVS